MSGKKILKATYFPRELYFKFPKDIDLEDESKVKEYWVKWGELHIQFVDGTFQKIENCQENEDDCKHPADTEIEDRDDYDWISDSEDGEGDEEEKEEDTTDIEDN